MVLPVRTGLFAVALIAAQAFAAPATAPVPAPATATSAPAPAPVPPPRMALTALNSLEPGLWQLDIAGRPSRQSCIADTTALVQIEHDQPNCSRFVIANEAKSSTVHYSCQRAGWGRTTVRIETPTAAVIQTQGISHNQPFDYTVQAHKVGACGSVTAAKQR
jgi:hypothetical protein